MTFCIHCPHSETEHQPDSECVANYPNTPCPCPQFEPEETD